MRSMGSDPLDVNDVAAFLLVPLLKRETSELESALVGWLVAEGLLATDGRASVTIIRIHHQP